MCLTETQVGGEGGGDSVFKSEAVADLKVQLLILKVPQNLIADDLQEKMSDYLPNSTHAFQGKWPYSLSIED